MESKQALRTANYTLFYLVALSLIVSGLFLDSPKNLVIGFYEILTSPSQLFTDYMKLAGMGAAFLNSGLIMLLTLRLTQRVKGRLTGVMLSAAFMMAGFGFFGKNLFNSIPITFGTYLYSRYKGVEFRNVLHIALFASCLGPLISMIAFGYSFSLWVSIPASYLVGILIGFTIVPLSAKTLIVHQGYNIYNVGFSAGLLGMLTVGIMRMFNLEIETAQVLYTGNDLYSQYYILAVSLFLAVFGFVFHERGDFLKILKESGRISSDFVLTYDMGSVLLNMGLLGLIGYLYAELNGGVLNGPTVGAILGMLGFGSFGAHVKNTVPVLLGVLVATHLNIYSPSDTGIILTGLFAVTLAPISGEFGVFAGFFAGFSHAGMVVNIKDLHGGVNLYNNGFSGGFVAATLVPLFTHFFPPKEKKTGDPV
ncbi:DUF1576 domain-containing protein [Guggenheimella bovis]